MQGVKDKTVQRLAVSKTHLGFTWVHIDVNQTGIQLDKQDKCRVPIVVQHVLVGLAYGVANEFIAHKAAVNVNVLAVAFMPIKGRFGRNAP